MSLDHDLAARVRSALSGAGEINEIKMFGGIGFMLNGNMVVAASKRGLLARVGAEQYAQALARPGSRPMEMQGRVMKDYVRVDPDALTDGDVQEWVRLAVTFVRDLPPKEKKTAKTARKTKKTPSAR